jgi:hypothetical protein
MSGFISDSQGDPVGEIPFGNSFEKAVVDFNKAAGKKIIADVGSWLTQTMSKATEPIFRRDMGERYCTVASISSSNVLWFLSGLISCFTGSAIGWCLSLGGLPGILAGYRGCIIPLVTMFGFMVYYSRFAKESQQRMALFRAEGKTYHSKSRGAPRWDAQKEMAMRRGLSALLLILAPAMGVAFIISLSMSANLEAQQQAALHDRYLDMRDQQIEAELLQDALLGKCPPEVTFLYKPLPETLKPELREDIAAAAVGKPVKIVAQRPKPAA